MSTTTKKIIAWIAGVLLAAGVIGTTAYKVIVGETTTKDSLKQVATAAQQYATDTVTTVVKEKKNETKTIKQPNKVEEKTNVKVNEVKTEVKSTTEVKK